VYRKIYHHASNLLVDYRVKWQKCVGQRCWHDFVIKDVTVKQVTLNDNRYVTDMDKINIVGLQAVLKMSFFSMDTRWMSSSPLVNSLVKNRLFKTAPNIDEPPFQFIHTMDLSVVDTMLIHRTDIWAVWRPQVGPKTFGVSWRRSSTVAHAQRSVPVRCTVNLKQQSCYQTLCGSLASVWRHYDVVKQHRRRQ